MALWLAVILLAGCASHQEEEIVEEPEECYLTIYVYTPSAPIVTRADVGYQTAISPEETAVNKLQLWVYKHDSGERVGYLEEENVTFTGESSVFRVLVSPEFADSPVNVDVYALANVVESNTGLAFTRQTTRTELETALLEGRYFGTSAGNLVQTVPAAGLPMSGLLKDKAIAGTFPALRIVNESSMSMATVSLVRMVSKLRFLLCRADDPTDKNKQLSAITSIKLNGSQIAQQEYVMLTEPHDKSINPANPLADNRMHLRSGYYVSEAANFGSLQAADIPVSANPAWWLYNESRHGTAAQYATLLENALAAEPKELKEFGLTYLRETDRKLQGTITYRVVSDEASAPDRTAVFEMDRAGDFTRNHSWTILVLFEGGRIRTVNIVDIGVRNWQTIDEEKHEFYNW